MDPTQAMMGRAMSLLAEGTEPAPEAWALLTEVLRLKPEHPLARDELTKLAMRTGRETEALGALEAAAAQRRSIPDLHYVISMLHMQAGRPPQAEKSIRKALAINQGAGHLLIQLGTVLRALGRVKESEQALRRACEIEPGSARCWYNLAENLLGMGRAEDALAAFRTAERIDPRNSLVLAGLGKALRASGRLVEAESILRRALEINPADAVVLGVLGTVLVDLGRAREGCAALDQSLAIRPRASAIRLTRLMSLNYFIDDGATLLREHRAFASDLEADVPALPPPANDPDPERRVRVGFLSADLREHSCARFLLPIFDGLDRARFEVFGLPASAQPDATTESIQRSCQGWIPVGALGTLDGANAVREASIDILIECSGHTAGNRLDICAARPAPVQMSFLGYPNTTGLSRIDYRLVDDITDPPGSADEYAAEQLLRLPGCLWCFRPTPGSPPVGPAPARSTGRTVIGCFNNLSKITPEAVRAWAEVLRRAPGSTLLLKNKGLHEAATMRAFRAGFEAHGVDGARIDAVPYAHDVADHLRAYDRIDFQLDTFPYNGTTTTCESFWQGVPIVAMAGRVHAARVSMSLLHAIGLDELLAPDLEGYIRIASDLANDPARLVRIRESLRARIDQSPLRDEPGYCRRFGAVLRQAWRDWCRDASEPHPA